MQSGWFLNRRNSETPEERPCEAIVRCSHLQAQEAASEETKPTLLPASRTEGINARGYGSPSKREGFAYAWQGVGTRWEGRERGGHGACPRWLEPGCWV